MATFAAALAAALALAACGGEDAKLLPGETAREITANLDTVKQLAGEGDCVGAESAVVQVSEQIEALEGVDPKLKRALEDGAARLEEVIAGCEEASSEAIAPAEIPAEAEEEGEKAPKQRGPKPKEEEAPEEKGSPSLPPQANGEAKGLERGGEPSAQEEPPAEETAPEGSSGGVSPGAPVGEGE
ncbi:MAG TPA: hypothetical protein VFJ99_02955 [Solirubrobacterales bacterium]|nr:hypothetical protein [Solirubrobacterales bacterium]